MSQPRRLSSLGRRYGYNPCPPKLEGIRRPVSGTLLLQGRRQSLGPPPSAEVSGSPGLEGTLSSSHSHLEPCLGCFLPLVPG